MPTLDTVRAWFSAHVAHKWENVLTTYFEVPLFLDQIALFSDGVVRVTFRGNPTCWRHAAHRVHLDIQPGETNHTITLTHEWNDDGDNLCVEFSEVPLYGIVNSPESLIEKMHDGFTSAA